MNIYLWLKYFARRLTIKDKSDFFSEGYKFCYPECEKTCLTPWQHYVIVGSRKGYDNGTHPTEKTFFAAGYLEMYPDVAKAKVDPWRHYVLNGKQEGRDNGTHPTEKTFFAAGYLEMYPDVEKVVLQTEQGDRNSRSTTGIKLGSNKKTTTDFTSYTNWIFDVHENNTHFVNNDEMCFSRKETDPKIFAYYLPQFHSIPLNDKNFGKGFTEWTNVTRSSPLFLGHVQPRIPYDLGFYSLDDISVIERQAKLAKQFGIYGFCFYYYWFSGERVLEKPLRLFLNSKIDLHFHLMWANENWAKLWDGGNKEVILEQKFDFSMIDSFYQDILPYIKDERYEKINNKPILAIYRPTLFDKELFLAFVSRLNNLAVKDGFKGFYFLGTNYSNFSEPKSYNLEGVIEFPPHGMRDLPKITDVEWFNYKNRVTLYDLHKWVESKLYLKNTSFNVFKCCFPGWDNSPRKAYTGGLIYINHEDDFYNWLCGIIRWTKCHHSQNEQYIYINAWNEWGEGAFLEPDTRLGYKSLVNVRKALEETR